MTRTHTIKVTAGLEALETELCQFVAQVKVNCIPESGDGWNTPNEPGYYEFSEVKQVSGPHIDPAKLATWAEIWVENNQTQIDEDIADRSDVEF